MCVSVSVWLDRLLVLWPDPLHGWDAAGLFVWRSHIWPVSLRHSHHKTFPVTSASSMCSYTTVSCLSCRYGKRPMLLVCLCVNAVCGLVPAVLPQPLLFLAVRCMTGICICCINISSFSLGNNTDFSCLMYFSSSYIFQCKKIMII